MNILDLLALTALGVSTVRNWEGYELYSNATRWKLEYISTDAGDDLLRAMDAGKAMAFDLAAEGAPGYFRGF